MIPCTVNFFSLKTWNKIDTNHIQGRGDRTGVRHIYRFLVVLLVSFLVGSFNNCLGLLGCGMLILFR